MLMGGSPLGPGQMQSVRHVGSFLRVCLFGGQLLSPLSLSLSYGRTGQAIHAAQAVITILTAGVVRYQMGMFQ